MHKKSHESVISVLLIYRFSDTQSNEYQNRKSLDQVTTSPLRNQTIEVKNHKLFYSNCNSWLFLISIIETFMINDLSESYYRMQKLSKEINAKTLMRYDFPEIGFVFSTNALS